MIVLLILAIIIILLLTMNIKIEIKDLRVVISKTRKKLINEESEIYLKIYILKKIKIAQFDLKKIGSGNKKFANKLKEKMHSNKFDIGLDIGIAKAINDIYILEKMNLKMELGAEDAAITALAVGSISSIIGILLKDKIRNMESQKYEVLPIYQDRNILKIKFDSIITFKMANIIYMIKFLIKRRVGRNGRTSYRRSYAYSNE